MRGSARHATSTSGISEWFQDFASIERFSATSRFGS